MARIVQKYGGTSVGDVDRIKNVAQRVLASRAGGDELVIVVSARSGVTNELLARAKALSPLPSERELDQLLAVGEQETIALTAIALHAIGVDAVSYTGAQAGIFTDKGYTKAKIKTINPKPIEKDLKAGRVVIVAGFQGIDEEGQITTLGRGGSDLTAIALAAALKADKCEIYTDVDGVYTADPRVVKTAQKLNEISYDEMLELASAGSKVMQSRSVEFAKKYAIRRAEDPRRCADSEALADLEFPCLDSRLRRCGLRVTGTPVCDPFRFAPAGDRREPDRAAQQRQRHLRSGRPRPATPSGPDRPDGGKHLQPRNCGSVRQSRLAGRTELGPGRRARARAKGGPLLRARVPAARRTAARIRSRNQVAGIRR